MSRLTFGEDLGPAKVVGLKAEHHCTVFLDGEPWGHLYKGPGGYEYRGKPVGADELSWITRGDKRDVINDLMSSLEAGASMPGVSQRKP